MQKAMRIARFLIDEQKRLNYIVYDMFRNIKGLETISDDQLLFILYALSNASPPLLNVNYELNLGDGSNPVPISKSMIKKSLHSGVFINPETGKEIENYKDFIDIYFTLGSFFTLENYINKETA